VARPIRTALRKGGHGFSMQTPSTIPGEKTLPDHSMRQPSLHVLGLRVDVVTSAEALALITRWVMEAREAAQGGQQLTRHVVTLNPEIVMAAQADAQLRDLINAADLVLPDGVGIVWTARLRGRRLGGRVTGVDTVASLAQLAATHGWRLFLLGAAPGVAEAAAARLVARCPGLAIAGTHAGDPALEEDERVAGLVHASRADIACVAYGAPAQERWIARNRERLGAAVALGVGGALDFVAGRVPRAPWWIRQYGLEWAYRLWRQPWRWRRMRALPQFAVAVLREQWQGRADAQTEVDGLPHARG
jgi:N-acetylglucosaminyldiphosphoundecaprenol N-acetyl-beta-D-mannosaminyltransferase